MKLVLIGIQGAGKSTQGNLLSRQLNLPYLSTGHIFREIAKEKTTLGRTVKEIINSGSLIPDDLTIKVVKTYLKKPEYKRGYLLDGFPRTATQAEAFPENAVDMVIHLEIPDKEAYWRIGSQDGNVRQDNTLAAVKKRIEMFHEFTEPVIEFYRKRNKVATIDGMKAVEEVNEEILKSLGKQLVENRIKNWKRKSKSILAIVGLPGSGKSEASEFYEKMGLPVISFGKVINDMIDAKKLEHNQENHKAIREGLREEHGFAALAIHCEKAIKASLKDHQIVIVDGMRSWEEYTYIKEHFPEVNVKVLAIYADKELRYKRIEQRGYRAHLYGEDRDISELINLHMGPTIANADYLVKNNFSLDEFQDKLKEVYRAVYYS